MMKVKKVLFGLMIICCAAELKAQNQEAHFKYEPQRPKPGQRVEITYDPAGTPLAGSKEVRAIVSSYNNYQWKVSDLAMTPSGKQFKASLQLDSACGIAALKFLSGDSTDTNEGDSYIVMTLDPKPALAGKNAAGAFAGWAFIRGEKFGYGVPGFLGTNTAISDTAFYYWLNNEIIWHPKESGTVLAEPFTKAVYAYQKDGGIKRIRNVIAYLQKQGGEKNLVRARNIYLQVLKEQAPADSLDAVMLQQYPHGSIARLKAYRALSSDRDLEKIRMRAEQFLTDFPQDQTDPEFDRQYFINYNNVYQSAIVLRVMNKDYSGLERYRKQLPFVALISLYYKIIFIAHSRGEVADGVLLPYAQQLFDQLESFKNRVPAENWNLSPWQWQRQYEAYVAASVWPVHINILRNTGHTEQALALAARAERYFKYKRAEVNNDYAFLLNKTKQYDKLRDVLVKSLYENQSSPEMLALLKEDYVRSRKSDKGFDTYKNALKNPALSALSKDEIKSKMINKDMPDWSMTDLNGKLVKFADLRGKTVVMDFWATWCVPCKASLPGMKLAVEHYKADPNVVFYFVDTEERGDKYKQEVAKYIKDNHYSFNVLFDNKLPKASINEEVFARICKAFTVSGIPMKLIIDPKGKLRFLTDGYKGSATALADEIIEMVELTRKSE